MASEPQKPPVTEINVRMDCNGCVQKIKKALHGIVGTCELYIDFPQQKVTVVGWTDPEKIVRAVKKTRKNAVICLHSEQSEQSVESTTESPHEDGDPGGEAPPSQITKQAAEPQQTEVVMPPQPPGIDNPQSEKKPSPNSASATTSQLIQPSTPKDAEEIHLVYHYPPDYEYRYTHDPNVQQGYDVGPWANPGVRRFRVEPSQPLQPVFVGHSYNAYEPSPYINESQLPQPVPMSHGYNRNKSSPVIAESHPPQLAQRVSASHSYNAYKPSPYMTESQLPQPDPMCHDYNRYKPSPPITASHLHQPVSVSHGYNMYKPSPYMDESQLPQPVPMSHGYNRYNPSLPIAESHPHQTVYVSHTYSTHQPSPYMTESQPSHPIPMSHDHNKYMPSPSIVESHQPQLVSTSHSYNTYKPSPYVTKYAYPQPPPSYYPHDGRPNNSGPQTQVYNYNTYKPSSYVPAHDGRPNNSGPQTQVYNYNTYKPSSYVPAYADPRSPPNFYPHYDPPSPPGYYSRYNRHDNVSQEYYNENYDNSSVISIFSEENPNSCTIV